jgi:hypothetical protein
MRAERQNKSYLGVGTSGRREDVRRGCKRWKHCVLVHENGKMRPVETIPGMGRGEIEENGAGAKLNYNILWGRL